MAPRVDHLSFARHSAGDVPVLLDEICAVYADAYGHVSGEDIAAKTSAFRERATTALSRQGFELVTARGELGMAGFVFGYSLTRETHWWDDLSPTPSSGFVEEDGSRTFVLAEIEVGRKWQGSGVGRTLHHEILRGRREKRATLATGPGADVARAIYEGWGWQKIGVVPGTARDYFSEYTLYVLPLPTLTTP